MKKDLEFVTMELSEQEHGIGIAFWICKFDYVIQIHKMLMKWTNHQNKYKYGPNQHVFKKKQTWMHILFSVRV